jgi:hypothetical protein
MDFRDILMLAAARVDEAAAGGGAELITNGGFDSSDNWTLANGAAISSGQLSLGTFSTATQTLAAGSQPAGDYLVTLDNTGGAIGGAFVLLGAGDEQRGYAILSNMGTGTGLTDTITATGEVSKVRISGEEDSANVIDNVSLVAA